MRRSRAALAAVLFGIACACSEPPRGDPATPPGAALVAERAALIQLLDAVAGLEGTPAGRQARELADALPACDVVEGHAPDADARALFAALRCRERGGPLEAFHAKRGERGVAFVWPTGAQGEGDVTPPLRGWIDVGTDGGVDAAIALPSELARGPRALLVPGHEAPGPAVLSSRTSLLHARLRPRAGLDLASLVPDGGQGDRMFRLKSELFRGVVLDGTWEAALYLPGAGEPMPRLALALGFARRATAVAALEGFVDELQEAWPVHRSFFSVRGHDGACLLDLRIFPAFAPCYVATERALVIGYNPASVRTALDGEPGGLGEAGGLRVDLSRLEEADARLAAAAGDAAPDTRIRTPWRHLRAEPEATRESVELRVRLEPETDA